LPVDFDYWSETRMHGLGKDDLGRKLWSNVGIGGFRVEPALNCWITELSVLRRK